MILPLFPIEARSIGFPNVIFLFSNDNIKQHGRIFITGQVLGTRHKAQQMNMPRNYDPFSNIAVSLQDEWIRLMQQNENLIVLTANNTAEEWRQLILLLIFYDHYKGLCQPFFYSLVLRADNNNPHAIILGYIILKVYIMFNARWWIWLSRFCSVLVKQYSLNNE